jgi:hypothetical protein
MSTYSSPRRVLDVWTSGVNSGALDQVVELYDEGAVLLPTFSNRSLSDSPRIKEYFEKLFRHEEVQVSLHEKTLVTQALSESIYSMSGIYRWEMEIDDEPLSFEARFSYVLDLESSAPIMHHHSSQVPRML